MASSRTSSKPVSSISTAATWKGRRAAAGIELKVPSGNVVLVRPMSIAKMISDGLLVDSLMPIVEDHIDKGQGKRPQDRKTPGSKPGDQVAAEAMRDPRKMAEMFDGMDRACASIVMEPTLLYHKRQTNVDEVEQDHKVKPKWEEIPYNERDKDTLYTDEVDLEDKMFIFNFMIGGTSDLETFREESGPVLDGLHDEPVDELPAK